MYSSKLINNIILHKLIKIMQGATQVKYSLSTKAPCHLVCYILRIPYLEKFRDEILSKSPAMNLRLNFRGSYNLLNTLGAHQHLSGV